MHDLTKKLKDRVRKQILTGEKQSRVRVDVFHPETRHYSGRYLVAHHRTAIDFVVFHKTFVFVTKGPYPIS